ncbi:MAG: RDD family protein [Acidimicrobiaceae bacterium]|nr:RDD family protein [Acidimicrobiaceae bacterium]
MSASDSSRSPEYAEGADIANLGDRIGAWVIDSLIMVGTFMPIAFFLIVYSYAAYGNPVGDGYNSEELAIMWVVPVTASAALGFYRIYRLMVAGQSPGMRRFGVEVVRLDNGKRLSFTRSLVRTALPPASMMLGLAAAILMGSENPAWGGLLWLVVPAPALWNRHRRGWHDQIAGAVAVGTRPEQRHPES